MSHQTAALKPNHGTPLDQMLAGDVPTPPAPLAVGENMIKNQTGPGAPPHYWVLRVPMRDGRDHFLLEAERILRRVVFERYPGPERETLGRLLEACQHGYREDANQPPIVS